MDLKQIITLQLDGFSNCKIGFTSGISCNTVNALKVVNVFHALTNQESGQL